MTTRPTATRTSLPSAPHGPAGASVACHRGGPRGGLAVALLSATVLLASCGGAQPEPKAATAPQATGATSRRAAQAGRPDAEATRYAPPPFTADQIRAATRPGRTYLFRLTLPGRSQGPLLREMRFVHAHSQGGQLSTRTLNADRSPRGEATVNTFTWAELVSHASYPKDATTVTAVSHTVPAGTFDCLRYEVRQEQTVIVAYFAKALPGAPVRHTLTEGGKLRSEMVLTEHKAR